MLSLTDSLPIFGLRDDRSGFAVLTIHALRHDQRGIAGQTSGHLSLHEAGEADAGFQLFGLLDLDAPARTRHRRFFSVATRSRASLRLRRFFHRLQALQLLVDGLDISLVVVERSEERLLGKECVSTLRSRGWPYH